MPFRYVWPAELDLMAELAGLRLRERWAAGRASRSPATALPRLGLGEAGVALTGLSYVGARA